MSNYHRFTYARLIPAPRNTGKPTINGMIRVDDVAIIGTDDDAKAYEARSGRWATLALVKVEPATAVEMFAELVDSHDLTYTYSDDHGAWLRGERELNRIAEVGREIDRDTAVRIWNASVDRKIAEGYRSEFYWRDVA